MTNKEVWELSKLHKYAFFIKNESSFICSTFCTDDNKQSTYLKFWSLFQDSILFRKYTVIHFKNDFYYFGHDGSKHQIVRLDAISLKWSVAGNLNSDRRGHAVIEVKDRLMIIGGDTFPSNTEVQAAHFKILESNYLITWWTSFSSLWTPER